MSRACEIDQEPTLGNQKIRHRGRASVLNFGLIVGGHYDKDIFKVQGLSLLGIEFSHYLFECRSQALQQMWFYFVKVCRIPDLGTTTNRALRDGGV